jgi:hypothetical protein
MELQTLEEYRETLADPEQRAKVDEVIAMTKGQGTTVEKAGIENGTEWHTQSSVGDVASETRSGINPEQPHETRDSFITPGGAKAAEGSTEKEAADAEKEAADAEKTFPPKKDDGDDDDEKAAAAESEKMSKDDGEMAAKGADASFEHAFMHGEACKKALVECSKADDSDDFKKFAGVALNHFSSMHKYFLQAQKAVGAAEKVQKSLFTGRAPKQDDLQEQLNALAGEVGRFAQRIDNEFGEIRKWMDKQPASRTQPTTASRDVDYSPALVETLRSRRDFQHRR